ncbi:MULTISPECIES: hypothetical protein [unclassified Spirosoma]|uniref:hypothetical protein n=1 Tax=unclassified Spirosoma TaxID=2621999 RepID=UPI00095EDA23|nr:MULTISPECIES: hypothetical protein [unclassified Spirosoma]MBN8826473.1 hypothetical protein [Spirosoma sp.]OJW76434.1 MAG: hypothetical protein BGO59_23255 [Spirosoma sp. 48-14]
METLTLTAPQILTIAHLDDDQDFSPLDTLLEKDRPYGCRAIEFIDDNTSRGYRALEYRAEVIARHEFDNDGCNPVFEWFPIEVMIEKSFTVSTVATLLIGQINVLLIGKTSY